MLRYVIAPGYGGSSPDHWQSLWSEELGDRAVMTSPTSWEEPDLKDWVSAVDRAVSPSAVSAYDEVIIIAHSLGCWAVAEWCAQSLARNVASFMLVAPPDPESEPFPKEDAASFISLIPKLLGRDGVVVFSQNDPYCTPDKALFFANEWGLPAHDVGAKGHLNVMSGLGVWEEGRLIRDSLALKAH